MNTTSSSTKKSGYKRKGVRNATVGSLGVQGFRSLDVEPLNQAPSPPITAPYNPVVPTPYMVPPNASVYGVPLIVAPLTEAMPGEPVVPTPYCIRRHPAYKGGWKVLRYFRADGRTDFIYNHKDHGRLRSKKQVLKLLDYLWSMQENTEKSAGHDEQGCSGSANQLADERSAAGAGQSAEGKDAAIINQSTEGKSAV